MHQYALFRSADPSPNRVKCTRKSGGESQPRMRHIASLDLQLFENFEMDITPLK